MTGMGVRVSRKGGGVSTCWRPCGARVGQEMNCKQATGMGSRERCLGHDEVTCHKDRWARCRENKVVLSEGGQGSKGPGCWKDIEMMKY